MGTVVYLCTWVTVQCLQNQEENLFLKLVRSVEGKILRHWCTNKMSFVPFPDAILWWVDPVQQLSTHWLLTSLLLVGWARDLEKQEWEVVIGWDWDTFKWRKEGGKKSDTKADTHHLSPADDCLASIQATASPSTHTEALNDLTGMLGRVPHFSGSSMWEWWERRFVRLRWAFEAVW